MHQLTVVLLIASAAFSQIDYSKDFSKGRITWYAQSNFVACDIPQSEWPHCTAALSEKHFQDGLACGATARLKNGDKEIEVMIVDLCPVQGNEQWCSGDLTHFDLGNTSTFSQLEEVSKGVAEIQFKWVPTPVEDKPIKLRLKDGVNAYWVALQVINHRYPIAKLEVKDPKTEKWETGNKLNGMWNYWQFSYSGSGLTTPYQIRITDQYGQVIEETGNSLEEKYMWEGTHQFPVWDETGAVVEGRNPHNKRTVNSREELFINGNILHCQAVGFSAAIIADIAGKEVARVTVDPATGIACLPQLRPGIYFVKVSGNGGKKPAIRWVRTE
jgi:expansin (peptidoglycan-binding protein)